MNVNFIEVESARIKGFSPKSIFAFDKETIITAEEVYKRVAEVSIILKEYGIKKNDYVATLSENNLDFIILVLALWKLNAVIVPLNLRLLGKELNQIISSTGCKFALVHKKIKQKINSSPVISFPFKDKSISTKKVKSNKKSPSQTALVIFTSGSTDKPKGVVLTFNNLLQSALIGNKILKHSNKDRWLASLPFYHIGGFSIIFRSLIFGTPLILPDSLSNNDLILSLGKYNPTLASLVPTQLRRMLEAGCNPNKELRNVLLGGGFTDKQLVLSALKKGWRISKVYGSTETSSFISIINHKELRKRPASSGKAILPNKILIVDKSGNPSGKNISGEIAVASPAVMKYYLNNREETEKYLSNNTYYTGDIGYLDNEGHLFVEARRSDLIVSGGENINPIEVENKISKHPHVIEVCVIGINDKEWGETAAAVIVTKSGKGFSLEILKDFLRNKLPGYKIPKKIFFLDSLPKNELGKPLRVKIKEMIIKM